MQTNFVLRLRLKERKLNCELIDLESMQIPSFPRPIQFPIRRQKSILSSFHKILGKMRKNREVPPRWFKDQLRTLGEQLWDGLLDKVFSKFDLEKREGSFLTFALDPDTVRFPWELALLKKRPRTLLCEILNIGRLRVVRHPYWETPSKRRGKKIRALVVGLNYGSYRNLEELEYPEEEAWSVYDLLSKEGIETKPPLIGKKAKTGAILKNLQSGIDILHFTGHGSMSKNKTVICCADKDLSAKQLKQVIDGTSVPKISFINACESATEKTRLTGQWEAYNWARLLAEYGAQALIATFWPVIDESSTTFAKWFYTQFVERKRPLGAALRYARHHTKTISKSPFTWPAYVLYGYPDFSIDSFTQIG